MPIITLYTKILTNAIIPTTTLSTTPAAPYINLRIILPIILLLIILLLITLLSIILLSIIPLLIIPLPNKLLIDTLLNNIKAIYKNNIVL